MLGIPEVLDTVYQKWRGHFTEVLGGVLGVDPVLESPAPDPHVLLAQLQGVAVGGPGQEGREFQVT